MTWEDTGAEENTFIVIEWLQLYHMSWDNSGAEKITFIVIDW